MSLNFGFGPDDEMSFSHFFISLVLGFTCLCQHTMLVLLVYSRTFTHGHEKPSWDL